MRPALGNRLVRGHARHLTRAYPSTFRREHREAFAALADDRWQRERGRGAGPSRATLVTAWLLLTDTWTGAALARRHAREGRAGGRPARGLAWDRGLLPIRLAVRNLTRRPLVTAVATLSLGLGIGLNTAVFSAVNALLYAAPVGVTDPARLVDICRTTRGSGCDTLGYPTYLDYRDRMTTLADVYAARFEAAPMSLGAAGGAELVYAQSVSANYFRVLGAQPALGRFFSPADERRADPLREVVLSHAFWQDRLGADPSVVGRPLDLNGDPYLVAGVAADGFEGATVLRPDAWVPLTSQGREPAPASMLASREDLWLGMGGRLASGASLAQARAESEVVMGGLARAYPAIYRDRGLLMVPTRRMPAAVEGVAPFLGLLLGLVGTVLIVACTNLGGLLLAGAAARAREVAVRRALGATRGQLVRMFVIETAVLFLPGLALAFVIAPVALAAIARLAERLPVPIDGRLPIDWRVVLFTVGVALLMALVTGLAPGWQATRGLLVTELKQDASAPRRQRVRQLFVATQVAFCLVSIVMAGLLLRAVRKAALEDPGFQIANIDIASVDFALGPYDEASAPGATERLREQLAAIPGVRAVGTACLIPLEANRMSFGDLRRPGDTGPAASIDASWSLISPEYLPTLRIPIVRGRNFTAADRGDVAKDAIVNEWFAAHVWPGADPVGQTLEMGDFRPGHETSVRRLTVVGVAKNATYKLPGESPTDFLYVPLAELHDLKPHFFIERTPGLSSAALGTAVRQTLGAFDRALPLVAFVPFEQHARPLGSSRSASRQASPGRSACSRWSWPRSASTA